MADTAAALRRDTPIPDSQAGISWTQGVRDGWTLAVDTLLADAATMTCPDRVCSHGTEWGCAVAALQARATWRTW